MKNLRNALRTLFRTPFVTVAQRTREFGLRMALGAAPGKVGRLVLKQVGWMTVIGGLLGIQLAVIAGGLAQSQLFGTLAYDPIVLGLAAIVLATVAIGAGLVPALRASRIDPMRALRLTWRPASSPRADCRS